MVNPIVPKIIQIYPCGVLEGIFETVCIVVSKGVGCNELFYGVTEEAVTQKLTKVVSDHSAFLIGVGAVGLILIDAAQCKVPAIILPGLLQYKSLVVLYRIHILSAPVYFLFIEVRAKFCETFVDPHVFRSFGCNCIPKPHMS